MKVDGPPIGSEPGRPDGRRSRVLIKNARLVPESLDLQTHSTRTHLSRRWPQRFMSPSSDRPDFVPEYNKPDAPGLHMNFDNTVSLYHIIEEGADFETAAQDLFSLLKEAQNEFPDWPRVLYLDIEGHVRDDGRLEEEMVELQQEFLIAAMGKFFTALALPLVSVVNPDDQVNDLPDELVLQPPDADLPEDTAWPKE